MDWKKIALKTAKNFGKKERNGSWKTPLILNNHFIVTFDASALSS